MERYTGGYAINKRLNERSRTDATSSYTGKNEAAAHAQSVLVLIFEARAGIIAASKPDSVYSDAIFDADMKQEILSRKPASSRHDGGANYGFADGHARWHRPFDFVIECDGTGPSFKP